jgi:cysteine desulfurase
MQAYLDNAATTKMDDEVIDFMHQIMSTYYGNPSSIYELGRQSRVIVEEARTTIAGLLKVLPAEIFFTSGGTESINTIINGVLQKSEIRRVITSRIEHSAMLKSITYYAKLYGKSIEYISVDEQGYIDIDELDNLLSESNGDTLVSLMHANNEIGTLLPIKRVSEVCKRNNALFFSDTVQTMGKYTNDLSKGYLDFAVASAHKFHGAKGVGFMYISGENMISPLLQGGSQERNMRAGTENIAAIAAMAKAFELSYENMEQNRIKYHELKEYLINNLEKEVENISFNGDVYGLTNLLNIGIPKTSNNEMYLMKLDINGIYVSGGSACSSGAIKDSHVIKAIGRNNEIRPIRLAMSKYTTKEELDYFVDVLKKL